MKAENLGTLGTEEKCSDEFPEFPFCLMYLKTGGGKAGNPGMPKSADKKNPQQNPVLFIQLKDQERGRLARQKPFRQ